MFVTKSSVLKTKPNTLKDEVLGNTQHHCEGIQLVNTLTNRYIGHSNKYECNMDQELIPHKCSSR